MRICSLASGSRGNSLFIESENARILVDAGLSALQIKNRLQSIDIDPCTIDAIILTHSHRDHVSGTDVFSHQFQVPIYGHPDTLDSLTYMFKRNQKIIPWTGEFIIEDMIITPFRVSHDAFPTVGYRISAREKTMAVCTDLGVVTEEVEQNLKKAHFLVIESNHDPDMLMNGPYPWELKERIASRVGHLSNHDTGAFLKKILNGRMNKILLAHLSEENNLAELAKNTVIDYLGSQHELMIDIIEQRKVSVMHEF
ncbi:MAG: MBL fold metallo-hydrolase [bacterium]|nr:MAG: MBL fold metallo-hydrolase [bacterium]